MSQLSLAFPLATPRRRITTRRRAHEPGCHEGPGGQYRVEVWDGEHDLWEEHAAGLPLMAIRAVLRDLEGWWACGPEDYYISREAT